SPYVDAVVAPRSRRRPLPHRDPPSPPLSPYTTLCRSQFPEGLEDGHGQTDILPHHHLGHGNGYGINDQADRIVQRHNSQKVIGRSEEHTSELQSRENVVWRLLLEKKTRPATTSCSAKI